VDGYVSVTGKLVNGRTEQYEENYNIWMFSPNEAYSTSPNIAITLGKNKEVK
jgi:hypothetical protein